MGGSSSVPATTMLYPSPAGTTIGYDMNPNMHLIQSIQPPTPGPSATGVAGIAIPSSSSAAAPVAGHVMSLF